MIGIKIAGGFGNQLFQYAFGYVNAKKLKTFFYIDKGENFKLNKYFKLRDFDNFYNELSSVCYKIKDRLGFIKIYNWEDVERNQPNYYINQIRNNIYYHGYFQSESFFQGYYKDLVKLFEVKKEYKLQFDKKYATFFKENRVVVVHVRRGDYVDFGNEILGGRNMILPNSYYKNSLNQIKDLKDYKIIFVSDDIDYVKNEFGESSNHFFESNSEIVDFQILLNADKIIMANSSFSWWASFLNQKAKEIYCPNYWLGFKVKEEHPPGILCKNWTKIDI